MQIDCPNCSTLIDDPDINVQTDVAFCRACDTAHRLSKLLEREDPFVDEPIAVDIYNPPEGAWFEQTGEVYRVGATCRVPVMACFLVPFTAVWAGGSMAGLYGSQIFEGKFDLLRTLFGIPFLLGSIALVSLTLFAIFGRVDITIRGREGEVFTGIGPIGRRRTFNTDDVKLVREQIMVAQTSSSGGTPQPYHVIVLDGNTPLKFGGMMREDRRHFIRGVLQTLLK